MTAAPASNPPLRPALTAAGFRPIPLHRNAVGQLELHGTFQGKPVRLLVDTGASNTVLHSGSLDRLGLVAPSPTSEGAGASGPVAVALIKTEGFALADTSTGPLTVGIIDLSHCNRALAQRGATPIDGVLGSDFLVRAEAVITVGEGCLYLRS